MIWIYLVFSAVYAAGPVKLIKEAKCLKDRVLIQYSDGQKLDLPFAEKDHAQCSDLKMSSDRKVAAWITECSGDAMNGNGTGTDDQGEEFQAVCAGLTAAFDGKTFEIDNGGFIRDLSFLPTNYFLKYYSAPIHGNGSVIIYDVMKRKFVGSCGEEENSEDCKKLLKTFSKESDAPQITGLQFTGGAPVNQAELTIMGDRFPGTGNQVKMKCNKKPVKVKILRQEKSAIYVTAPAREVAGQTCTVVVSSALGESAPKEIRSLQKLEPNTVGPSSGR